MKHSNNLRTIAYTLCLLLVSCGVADADMGVPMLFVTLPTMLTALIPIIAVETYIRSRRLHITMDQILKPVVAANLFSTLIGIPLTWGILLLMQVVTGGGSAYGIETTRQRLLAVTWQAPWLIPYDSELHWMIPAAMLVLLVPFFFASWFSEYQVAKRLLKDVSPTQVKSGMFFANLASYALLLVWVMGWLLTIYLKSGGFSFGAKQPTLSAWLL